MIEKFGLNLFPEKKICIKYCCIGSKQKKEIFIKRQQPVLKHWSSGAVYREPLEILGPKDEGERFSLASPLLRT